MKIIEILSSQKQESTFKRLEKLSQSQGWGLQFKLIEAEAIETPIPQWLEKQRLAEGVHFVRLDIESGFKLLSAYAQRPNIVNLLANMDHLVFEKGHWWPQLLVFEALRLGMIHKVRNIDTLSCGYVVGSNQLGAVSAAVLISMGIRKVYWLGERLEFLKEKIQNLQAHFVGVEFKSYPVSTITTLLEKGAVLICAINLGNQRDLLADLLYFNYIKKGGLVGNIIASAGKDTFLQEAEKAELAPFSALNLNLELDWQLIHKLGLSNKISFSQFSQLWLAQG